MSKIASQIQSKLKRTLARWIIPGFDHHSISYSQSGEDLIVSCIFRLRGIARPRYIDIGAHHPYYISNSALFYACGSKGVNIEPNPVLFPQFLRDRPRDINLNVGIGSTRGSASLYCMDDPALSTFSKNEVELLTSQGKRVVQELRVPIMTLADVIGGYCGGTFPDFLTLDVEGYEMEILGNINFSENAPKVICIETVEYSGSGEGAKRDSLIAYIESKNYLSYGGTHLNSIYVQREFWGV